MAWPTTTAGSLVSGYLATTDLTTVVWGTKDILANIGGVVTAATSFGVVTRFSQKVIQDVIRLPNGDGLTSGRIHIVDGHQWTLTIRDDTRITVRPKIGNTVLVYDAGGLITGGAGASGSPTSHVAVIVEVDYETAPKQAAEFTITVENLTLFTEAQVNLA